VTPSLLIGKRIRRIDSDAGARLRSFVAQTAPQDDGQRRVVAGMDGSRPE